MSAAQSAAPDRAELGDRSYLADLRAVFLIRATALSAPA